MKLKKSHVIIVEQMLGCDCIQCSLNWAQAMRKTARKLNLKTRFVRDEQYALSVEFLSK